MIPLNKDKSMLGYELLSAFPNISHFVTTRSGGCSQGNYASFNCTPYTGDDPDNVRQNQEKLRNQLPQPPARLFIPRQVHGTEIAVINSITEPEESLEGIDALITDVPGACLCISTADCIPLLIYDKRHKVIAAIHAGWRGTVNYIVSKTLRLMADQFETTGADVVACIGPGISLSSFEVGDEVYDAFAAKGFDMTKILTKNATTGKYYIDLWAANRVQLEAFGIPTPNIECAGICTYVHYDTFFSARRLGIKSGRILSGIMINS